MIKSGRLKWADLVARREEVSAFKILTFATTGKRPLERPRHRWANNIRMYLKEIGINTRNWADSAQDMDYWRVFENEAFNLLVP